MAQEDQGRLAILAGLARMEEEVRKAAGLDELGFLMVNETRSLVDYRQALFYHVRHGGRLQLGYVSGVADPDRDGPFLLWLKGFLQIRLGDGFRARAFQASQIEEEERARWEEWLAEFGYWLPLSTRSGQVMGGLFFTRPAPFRDPELWMFQRLAGAYGYAWEKLTDDQGLSLLEQGRGFWQVRKNRLLTGVFLLLLAVFPVRLSVLAPTTVAPVEPQVVSSPLEGVVREFHVAPNQPVKEGDILFTLDDTTFRSRHQVAEKALAVAEEDLLRSMRKGFRDDRSKAEVALLEARRRVKEAELAAAAEELAHIEVKAERDGIAVFGDPNQWIGKPVRIGEKILTLADPAKTEAEAWLPVEDAIVLEHGARILVFLNTAPANPLEATLYQASFEAEESPEGVLAFRIRATFVPGIAPPRIGLKGTAKIHGERVSLFYYVMRRPLAALRQITGW